jgi:hypothetical protein
VFTGPLHVNGVLFLGELLYVHMFTGSLPSNVYACHTILIQAYEI